QGLAGQLDGRRGRHERQQQAEGLALLPRRGQAGTAECDRHRPLTAGRGPDRSLVAGRRVLARRQARLRREHGREGHSGTRAGRDHAARHGPAPRGQGRPGGDPFRRQVVARDYRGFTHVSDHARHALDACRSPRVSAHGWPVAKRPFHSTCAERAGKNVLKTPIGRLLKPGGAFSTNGSTQSYHVSRMGSEPETTVSTAVERGSPERPNSAVITGALVSANAGKSRVSIVRWSQRATATLSLKILSCPELSSLCANSTWPAPDGHQRTRQWLNRSDCVLPPSWLRRMNEFSPVIKTALGSTGGVMVSSSEGRHLDARVVVAGALGNVGVVGRAQRRDGLAVVARPHPGALERADDPSRDDLGDDQR